jgi:hypothetical protein
VGDDTCHELSYDLYFIALLLGPSVGQYIEFINKNIESVVSKPSQTGSDCINLFAPELFFLILTHPVYKM